MIIVNGFQPLTIITKCSILDVAAVVEPRLAYFLKKCRITTNHFRHEKALDKEIIFLHIYWFLHLTNINIFYHLFIFMFSLCWWYKCVLNFGKSRSSQRRCSLRKGVLRISLRKGILRNFAKITGKHLCQSLFLIKKRLWHVRFSVDFAKFLRTPFYKTPTGDCSWKSPNEVMLFSFLDLKPNKSKCETPRSSEWRINGTSWYRTNWRNVWNYKNCENYGKSLRPQQYLKLFILPL